MGKWAATRLVEDAVDVDAADEEVARVKFDDLDADMSLSILEHSFEQ